MAKKKPNPNKIPVNIDAEVLNQIKLEATNDMVLRAWALILAALSVFYDTKASEMQDVWHVVNLAPTKIRSYQDVKRQLDTILEKTGVQIPIHPVENTAIHTQGELTRYVRKTYRYAMSSALAILSEPIMIAKMYPDEKVGRILQKVLDLDEEIEEERISLQDILEMLLDEYGAILEETESGVKFSLVEPEE